jgi:hypothetical protein
MTRLRRALPLAAWIAGLVATLAVLGALGHGQLAAPPLRSATGLRQWVDERGAATAAFAVLRILAVGATWYLLGTTVLGVAARATRDARLIKLADAASLPVVRRLASGIAGVGLTASAALGVAPLSTRSGPPPQPQASATAAGVATMQRLPDGAEVMRRLPDGGRQPIPGGEGTARLHRVVDEAPPPPAPPAPAADDTWVVAPGDHLWRVAEETLAEAWGRQPSDDEVVPYWQAVIETNRARLADPANPDLLFPGQTLTLPAVPPS